MTKEITAPKVYFTYDGIVIGNGVSVRIHKDKTMTIDKVVMDEKAISDLGLEVTHHLVEAIETEKSSVIIADEYDVTIAKASHAGVQSYHSRVGDEGIDKAYSVILFFLDMELFSVGHEKQ